MVIDNFTKFVELFPVKDVAATISAECLLEIVGRYGPVSVIRSDNGGQFTSDVFKYLVENYLIININKYDNLILNKN